MAGPEFFADTTIIMYQKLLLAMFLGALIGTERAIVARQTAGTRTFGLVAMGACLFVLAGNFIDSHYLGVVNFNPSQVAAAVVTGIGFLGAGLIIFRGDTLHGVTTAAGLWMVAGIGIAVGFGMYEVAIFATLLSLVLFTGMWYIEHKVKNWVAPRVEQTADSL
jgi:putative Mg2+ transporter-C (MgtC) family protein